MISIINYKEEILNLLREVQREGISDLIEFLESSDYFDAPGSTIFHCNFEKGLCEHSYKVYKCFEKKNEIYKLGLDKETIIICGLLHDLCKVNFYKKGIKNVKDGKKINGYGKEVDNWIEKEVWERNEKNPLGHGHKSVIQLLQYIKLTDFEMYAIIYHMGVPEDYEGKQGFNKAKELYPAIVCLHTADFESSTLLEKTIK